MSFRNSITNSLRPVNSEDDFSFSPFDILEDFERYYGEYSKYHDWLSDFENLTYPLMCLRISGLKEFSEDVSLRMAYLLGRKLDKDTRKRAKAILNETQTQELDFIKIKNEEEKVQSLANSYSDKALKTRENNLRKLKERG